MKKMKLLTLLALTIPVLAGCGKAENACKDAWEHCPLLLDSSTGKELEVVSIVRDSPDYNAYLALDSFYYAATGETYEITWEALPAGKWKSVAQKGDSEGRTKFTPIYADEEFECSLKATMKKGNDEMTGEWKFKAGTHTAEDLTDYTYMSIRDLNDKFINNSTDVVNKKIYTYGKITATVEESQQHIYSGFWIQDGEYALYCYQVYESQWFALAPQIGDTVIVGGNVANYNGLMEMYVYSKAGQKKTGFFDFPKQDDEKAAAVAAPVKTNIDTYTWAADNKDTRMKISALVEMTDLLYVSGAEKMSPGTACNLNCKKGNVDVVVTVNYHIGTDAYNAMKAVTDKWVANQTRFDFYGVLSAYNNLNLNPIFGVNSIIVKQ